MVLTFDDNRAQETLSFLEKKSNAGVWSLDFGTGKMVWSDGFYDLLGLTEGSVEPSYEAIVALMHPDDRRPCRRVRPDRQRRTAARPRIADHSAERQAALVVQPDRSASRQVRQTHARVRRHARRHLAARDGARERRGRFALPGIGRRPPTRSSGPPIPTERSSTSATGANCAEKTRPNCWDRAGSISCIRTIANKRCRPGPRRLPPSGTMKSSTGSSSRTANTAGCCRARRRSCSKPGRSANGSGCRPIFTTARSGRRQVTRRML